MLLTGRREQGAQFVDVKGRRYKQLLSQNHDGIGGGILRKEKLCQKIVEV